MRSVLTQTLILIAILLAGCGKPAAAPTCDAAGAMKAAEREAMETRLGLYARDYLLSHPTGDMNRYARQTEDGPCTWYVYSYVSMQSIDNPRNQQRRYLAADVRLEGKQWRVTLR